MLHGGAPGLRRRKTAADRRSQRLRAEGRGAQRLLRAFAAVREGRGGQLTPLAEALSRALGEMIVEAHAPMPQEEILHVPKIDQQEEVHVPTIIQQACIHQQQAEMVTDAPVPMTQEESGCVNVHSSNYGASAHARNNSRDGASDARSSSSWGNWALCTASPLRTVENELGVQTMDGSFDTAGFAEVPAPMAQGEIVHAPTII